MGQSDSLPWNIEFQENFSGTANKAENNDVSQSWKPRILWKLKRQKPKDKKSHAEEGKSLLPCDRQRPAQGVAEPPSPTHGAQSYLDPELASHDLG